MQEKVQEILERELDRLDSISREMGLTLDNFRALELLIKCHSTHVSKLPKADEEESTSPEASSTEALLEGLNTSDASESES